VNDARDSGDVAGVAALGLFLVGLALTLLQVDVGGPASDVSFVAGFITLLGAGCLHRRGMQAPCP